MLKMITQGLIIMILLSTVCASKKASLTWYNSYAPCCPNNPNYDPHADKSECEDYSACKYSGDFAAIGHRSLDYVKSHDLISFYDNSDPKGVNFMKKYGGKTVKITQRNGKSFTATIADTCANDDCDGCCTKNSRPSGYLVDVEYYTALRHWGSTDALENDQRVDWELI